MARILIVEDEHRIASFVAKGLRADGHRTTTVADGRDGLDHALSGDHDLVLLDVGLPGMDGFEVLDHLRSQMVEIGRSCIDADYRNNAAVIALLWSGLARYMLDGGHQYLIGCASIGLADGGHNAAAIWAGLSAHMAPAEYRVFPKVRLPLERLTPNASSVLPPLARSSDLLAFDDETGRQVDLDLAAPPPPRPR